MRMSRERKDGNLCVTDLGNIDQDSMNFYHCQSLVYFVLGLFESPNPQAMADSLSMHDLCMLEAVPQLAK